MRKFTLLFSLLAFTAQSQNFPAPYCALPETTIEIITSVKFGNKTILNIDDTKTLINKTDSIVTVVPGRTYTIEVEGDTQGDFDNNVVAFIDWNRNDILDDAGEIFEVGTITNSDGTDAVIATMEITIPTGIALGTTRIRITKTYTDDESVAEINPCAIEMDAFVMGAFPGFGQALDFTLNISSDLSVKQLNKTEIALYPNPAKNKLTITATSAIKEVKIMNVLGQEVYSSKSLSQDATLDISTLTSGHYFVAITTTEGQQNLKFIKE